MQFLSPCIILSLAMLFAGAAAAEQPSAAKPSPVQNASFDRVATGDSRQRVTFTQRPARVGDQAEQTLTLEMRMATTLRQRDQIGEKTRTTVRNKQHRVVTATRVEADRAVAVRLRYLEASKQLSSAEGQQPTEQASGDGSEIAQPVAGKTYLCQRRPGKDSALEITDEAGQIPPSDECEIVAEHMAMVGRPNPLAELLAGKSLVIDQTIALPPKIAGKIFNLGQKFDEVTRFELTLKQVKLSDHVTCAQFLARIDAASTNASQTRMQLEGPLIVEAETCRAVQVDLSGPIAMSETRGSFSTSYQVIGIGQLQMSVASTYRDANR